MSRHYLFTSESVTEGHPDKVCDGIADAILDACLTDDATSRVAAEVLVKANTAVVAGEITSRAKLDVEAVVRSVVRDIGYVDPEDEFSADGLTLVKLLSHQAPEIAQHVDAASDEPDTTGAGDQGMMFGYATRDTPELMPLPIHLAHRLARGLTEDRKAGRARWLKPDGKTQVTVRYEDNSPKEVTDVLVSANHAEDVTQEEIRAYVESVLMPSALGEWQHSGIRVLVNPSGSFVHGGPSVDSGLTGRKNIVDTYGGFARHGGGSFSGKDPSKVDRSGAYFCRWVARQLVLEGLAERAEVEVAYAIGRAEPVSLMVDTFGTGDAKAATEAARKFDFRPGAIVERFDLRRPIYRETTHYGHFGKPSLPWER